MLTFWSRTNKKLVLFLLDTYSEHARPKSLLILDPSAKKATRLKHKSSPLGTFPPSNNLAHPSEI
jgi:hypothetical protein